MKHVYIYFLFWITSFDDLKDYPGLENQVLAPSDVLPGRRLHVTTTI